MVRSHQAGDHLEARTARTGYPSVEAPPQTPNEAGTGLEEAHHKEQGP